MPMVAALRRPRQEKFEISLHHNSLKTKILAKNKIKSLGPSHQEQRPEGCQEGGVVRSRAQTAAKMAASGRCAAAPLTQHPQQSPATLPKLRAPFYRQSHCLRCLMNINEQTSEETNEGIQARGGTQVVAPAHRLAPLLPALVPSPQLCTMKTIPQAQQRELMRKGISPFDVFRDAGVSLYSQTH